MTQKAKKTLYLVDGSGYIFRAYHANIRARFATSKGFPTGAIFGFTNMLRKLVGEHSPDYLAIAFDAAKNTFRTEMYSEYKANRSKPDDDLLVQIPRIHELTQAFKIPILLDPRVEADDLIATMTRKARAAGLDVVIVTSDKDLMQLIGEGVRILDTRKDRYFDTPDVIDRFQVPPEQVVEVLGLAGDSSDNIPGVPGIGEKTAGKLIVEFGTIENLMDNIDKVSGKKRKENLQNFKDQAFLSRDLVRLKEDCEVAFDLEDLALSNPDFPALAALFREFEFHSHLRAVEDRLVEEEEPAEAVEKSYATVLTEEDLDKAIAACRDAGTYALDLETTSVNPHEAEIVGIALAWKDHEGVYIPVGHRYLGAPKQLSEALVLRKIKALVEDESVGFVAHHAKYEWIILKRYGIEIGRIANDTMLASYVLDPGRSHSLDSLAREVLRYKTITFEEVAGKGRNKKTFDEVDVEQATQYAAEDADVTLLLHKEMEPKIQESKHLTWLLHELEIPLALVLARMEKTGILLEPSNLQNLSAKFGEELQKIEQKAHEIVGRPFNLNSPKQLRVILFEELELPVVKKTKSGPSTDQSVLEKLAGEHELPALILEHRSLAKLKSTYIDALPALADKNQRIHTSFNQAVAATGRLSSSNPNLQNIPIRTARGRQIRSAFVPREGYTLLSADYSQVELRILAHLSGDKALCDAFNKGQDVHRRTASEIFGVLPLLVTKEQRASGKTINFGVIYGMGANRLAESLKIPRGQAKKYIEAYFQQYSGVKGYFDELIDSATNQGYAETMLGRRRMLPQLTDNKPQLRALGERLAINTPIQGTSADLIKLAMIKIQKRLDAEMPQAIMLLQVHDELVFEVPDQDVEALRRLVREEMAQVVPLKVPLCVDTATGKTWLDAK